MEIEIEIDGGEIQNGTKMEIKTVIVGF